MQQIEQPASTHDQLLEFVEQHGIAFRQVDHPAEGRTDRVSEMRGNRLQQAVKAMVVTVKINKQRRRHFLVCIGGHRRVNFAKVAALGNGAEARFAAAALAESLTGCVMGSVPPISFNSELNVVVDPELLRETEVVFNAGRLDRSMFVSPTLFFMAMNATVAHVAE